MKKIGILALQGDYKAHVDMLTELNALACYVRQVKDLNQVEGLILPGGESSTMLTLMHESGLFSAIREMASQGMPLFGTCAGAILMAKKVSSPEQNSLGLVNISIARNAYGRQLASKVVYGSCKLIAKPLEMVLIRAPKIIETGDEVEVIAEYAGTPMCVRQNQYLCATFHPELTTNLTLHSYFLNLV